MNHNNLHDINRFPEEEGLLLWGISMNRIGNVQSVENTFKDLQKLDTKIGKTNGIGMVMLYSDYLYFHSDEPSSVLRDRYKDLMFQHKNGFLKTLLKDNVWIKKAFAFSTFGQLMLDNSDIFSSTLSKVLDLYNIDEEFRACVEFDAHNSTHGLGEKEKMFILEEITTFYLATKGKLQFNNKFVPGTEHWLLQVYPGKPLKSEVYLSKLNPLKLQNPRNKYEDCQYDLTNQRLYKYSEIDLDTFDFV